MDQNELIELSEAFLRYDFSLREVVHRFGPVRRQTSERAWLSPRPESNLDEVVVEHRGGIPYSLKVELEVPCVIDLGGFVEAFGDCEELQRLSPFTAVPYRFRVEGDSQEILLILYASDERPPHVHLRGFALYRAPRAQLEGAFTNEGQLFQLVELFLDPRISKEQLGSFLGAQELPGGQLSGVPEKNIRGVELVVGQAEGELEGLWLHLQEPIKLSREILSARFGVPEWSLASNSPFGPALYDFAGIRRRGLIGSLSLQSPNPNAESAMLTESLLLRRTPEAMLGYPFWDRPESLQRFVESFFAQGTTDDFVPDLVVGRPKEETPFGVELLPERGSNLRRATLEKSHSKEGVIFISGVSLQLQEPIEVDWSWLESTFGKSSSLPSWKLPGHQFYHFSFRGSKSVGQLWLGVSSDLPGRWIESVALRRVRDL